tara:strand:- start:292 stop:582 length:291 start_codon:yes stop_codon:yes gene_type:complete
MFFVLGATPTQEKKEVVRFVMPAFKQTCFSPIPCTAYAIGYDSIKHGAKFADYIEIKIDSECFKKNILPLVKKDKEKNERQISLGFSKIADIKPFH